MFLRLPYSIMEATIYSVITYWAVGLAPDAGRFFTFWLLMVRTPCSTDEPCNPTRISMFWIDPLAKVQWGAHTTARLVALS